MMPDMPARNLIERHAVTMRVRTRTGREGGWRRVDLYSAGAVDVVHVGMNMAVPLGSPRRRPTLLAGLRTTTKT